MAYLSSVWLHIIAAAVWVGGSLFLVLVLMPVVRKERPRDAAVLTRLVGQRFRAVGWAALVLLIVSGIGNLASRGIGWSDVIQPSFWQSSFGRMLGIKLSLVLFTLILSLLHDLVIGPRATAAWKALQGAEGAAAGNPADRLKASNPVSGAAEAGNADDRGSTAVAKAAAEAARSRRRAAWIGRLNLLIALAIVALGVMLVGGTP